ncbi:MAG: hypothetical protein ABI623_08890 [bacterium]
MRNLFFFVGSIMLYALSCLAGGQSSNAHEPPSQYLLINGQVPEHAERNFKEIDSNFGNLGGGRIAIAACCSPLNS